MRWEVEGSLARDLAVSTIAQAHLGICEGSCGRGKWGSLRKSSSLSKKESRNDEGVVVSKVDFGGRVSTIGRLSSN